MIGDSMNTFQITIRTADQCITYPALAASSADAAIAASTLMGDAPCGITVTCAG